MMPESQPLTVLTFVNTRLSMVKISLRANDGSNFIKMFLFIRIMISSMTLSKNAPKGYSVVTPVLMSTCGSLMKL